MAILAFILEFLRTTRQVHEVREVSEIHEVREISEVHNDLYGLCRVCYRIYHCGLHDSAFLDIFANFFLVYHIFVYFHYFVYLLNLLNSTICVHHNLDNLVAVSSNPSGILLQMHRSTVNHNIALSLSFMASKKLAYFNTRGPPNNNLDIHTDRHTHHHNL